MIALLAETTYDELLGNPLTPLYLLCMLGGLVAGTAYFVFAVACRVWEDVSFWWRMRDYRARRASGDARPR